MDHGDDRQSRVRAAVATIAQGIAAVTLAAWTAQSLADRTYETESQCLRAESPEYCARQFPPPPPAPVQSLPLSACTEMMTQAGIIAARATTFAQLEQYDKVSELTRQFHRLAESAFNCRENAQPADARAEAAWREAFSETNGRYHSLQALMQAVNGN